MEMPPLVPMANALMDHYNRSQSGEWSIAVVQSDTKMKALPQSIKDLAKEYSRFLANRNLSLEPPPRIKLCYYIISSEKINRPLHSPMILLVGSSGVGKSSTINHLLDTGEGDPVAMISDQESKTNATTEYLLTVDEPDYEVRDLSMSIIDTPGLNDTAGVDQDACNFASMKQFLQTHPNIDKKIYPNLVFLVVSAMDKRIAGVNSNLVKTLRGIKYLEVVDKNHPNLVVILTFCCSVPRSNVHKWKEKIEKKKQDISTVVFKVLAVRAPVIPMENAYGDDDHDLEKDGDFTVLPNDERQPKNLYEACLLLLEENRDHFGLMVLNSVFQRAKKYKPKKGHEVKAKSSCTETLSEHEKVFALALSEAYKGDPLAMRAMDYIVENNLDCSQKEDLMKLVESMNSLGLSDDTKLQSVTIGEINYVHSEEISEHGFAMLEKKFGIKSEIAPLNSAQLFGQGYDIIADKSVDAEIMQFETVDDKTFGFKIPGYAQISKVNETRERHFNSNESYVESRLKNLGLNIQLSPILVAAREKNDNCGTSTKITEYRMVKIHVSVENLKVKDFSKVFSSAVEMLPDQYTNDDDTNINSNKLEFDKFFERFGHFVVTSAFVGGSVEVTTCGECPVTSENDEKPQTGSTDIKISVAAGLEADVENETSIKSSKKATMDEEKTVWRGGRNDLHDESTLKSEEKLKMWKASLAKDPILLTTEMNLLPISDVVAIMNKEKGDSCYKALCNRFGVDDMKAASNPQEKCGPEAENPNEEDELRKASNSRAGSTKQPDSKGWWQMLLERLKHFFWNLQTMD